MPIGRKRTLSFKNRTYCWVIAFSNMFLNEKTSFHKLDRQKCEWLVRLHFNTANSWKNFIKYSKITQICWILPNPTLPLKWKMLKFSLSCTFWHEIFWNSWPKHVKWCISIITKKDTIFTKQIVLLFLRNISSEKGFQRFFKVICSVITPDIPCICSHVFCNSSTRKFSTVDSKSFFEPMQKTLFWN